MKIQERNDFFVFQNFYCFFFKVQETGEGIRQVCCIADLNICNNIHVGQAENFSIPSRRSHHEIHFC